MLRKRVKFICIASDLLLLLYWLWNTVAKSHKIKQLFTYCLHKIDCTVVISCEKALLDSPHRPWLEHLAWGTLSDTHRALHNERHYLLITTCSGWRDSAYTYPISQGVLATGIASKSHDTFFFKKAVGWCHPVKVNCTAWKPGSSLNIWNNFRIIKIFLNSPNLLTVNICNITAMFTWFYTHSRLFQHYDAFAIKSFM